MEDDSILGSQEQRCTRGLIHLRRSLKEKLSQNTSESRVLEESKGVGAVGAVGAVEEPEDQEEDSVLIQSQKNSQKEPRVILKRCNVFDLDSPTNVESPLPKVDDSVSPARNKGLKMKRLTRGALQTLGQGKSPSQTSSIRSKMSSSSIQDRDVDQFFAPNFESTRLLNITAPLTPQSHVRPVASKDLTNLSLQSLYHQKLSTKQVAEGGTQVTPLVLQNKDDHVQKENEANLSIKSIYQQRLRNKLVSEGGTQTTPSHQEPPSNNQDPKSNNISMTDVEVASNVSNSSIVSGFINELCQTESKEILVPFTEEDFDDRVNVENNSPIRVENTSRVSHPEAPVAPNATLGGSIHENLSLHQTAPNDENDASDPPVDSMRENPFMNSSGPNEENPTSEEPVSGSHRLLHKTPSCCSESDSESESIVDRSVRHQPDKIMKKLTPGSFRRRYGVNGKEHDVKSANSLESKKKYARKSIHVNKGRVLGFEAIESLVSLKEGFEHFSLFCPYDLNKKAKETFMKVSQDILSDIINRVTDEALYNSGRTNACLKDIKQVMLQYKCFPPSPKDARYKNQHLYRFLNQNCDARAAKCLLPMSSFGGKRNKFFVDIWDEVDDEAPKGVRSSKRVRKK